MLGDGNVYVKPNNSLYLTRVCGNLYSDREYLLTHVKPLFERVFRVTMRVYEFKAENELFLYKSNKDLVTVLLSFGSPPGDKLKNNIGIPEWILSNHSFLKACIRGLVDTDGSVYPKTPLHPAPSIWFKSAIPNLRETFRKGLLALGFHPTKWGRALSWGKNVMQCSLGRAKEVRRYYFEVGFNNPKHDKRFRRFI
ncbi:MAG: LAGLIDADG family homing endonuclease, partial [Candidatus Hadarchaeaceae archaeon]